MSDSLRLKKEYIVLRNGRHSLRSWSLTIREEIIEEFVDVINLFFREKKNLTFIGNSRCVTKKTLISKSKEKKIYFPCFVV